VGGFMDGHTGDRSEVPILDRDHTTCQLLSQDLFQALRHGSTCFTRSYDVYVGVTLQIIGHTINVESVSLAHDGAPHCGNGINRRYPSGEDVPAILAELLDSA
jgi:hypothetical protein